MFWYTAEDKQVKQFINHVKRPYLTINLYC
jgi:hypothetical protein